MKYSKRCEKSVTKLEKFLRKLTAKRRLQIEPVIEKIVSQDFSGLNLGKLGGFDNLFRVRQGDIRVVFSMSKDEPLKLIRIEFRGNTTYHF